MGDHHRGRRRAFGPLQHEDLLQLRALVVQILDVGDQSALVELHETAGLQEGDTRIGLELVDDLILAFLGLGGDPAGVEGGHGRGHQGQQHGAAHHEAVAETHRVHHRHLAFGVQTTMSKQNG
ncbi:hypothetical protein D3C79_921460 [compost metagenome]